MDTDSHAAQKKHTSRAISSASTNLILNAHFVDSAQADRGQGHDAVFDAHAISLERHKEANLAGNCFGVVAPRELEHREEGDGDDPEDREENPVELVEKAKVWSAVDNKTTVSVADKHKPVLGMKEGDVWGKECT